MIDIQNATLGHLAIHHIGCKSRNEDLIYSAAAENISEDELHETMLRFFTSHFREPEFFRFTWTGDDFILNPVYNLIANIFDDPSSLHEHSVRIARLLYDTGDHPNIKSGDLIITHIQNVAIGEELFEAVGIIKSENKEAFLQTVSENKTIGIILQTGIATARVDKACLILNKERDNGFRMLNIDHSNRNREALYWRDDFLRITPVSDDYQHTKNYIQVTKEFIKERMPAEFDTDKSSEAAMMSRSFEYFKNNEKFDAHQYEVKVFKDDKVVEAFQDFRQNYQDYKSVSLAEDFDISQPALKKHSRVFRSIIKLDKNFHIYVHGDKNRIQKGADDDGRKYYILYYDEES